MYRNAYDELAYLDSDLFFFDDPKIVFEEIGGRSIAIVPHRFSRENRYLEVNGHITSAGSRLSPRLRQAMPESMGRQLPAMVLPQERKR